MLSYFAITFKIILKFTVLKRVGYCITLARKVHEVAERLIEPSAIDSVEWLLGENSVKLGKGITPVSLPNNTVTC